MGSNHPALTVSGARSWPWFGLALRPNRLKNRGEVGVFTGTVLNDRIANAIFLKMALAGEPYMGFLSCNDPGFCRQLHDMLQNYIGRTIREIGNLDLGFTS